MKYYLSLLYKMEEKQNLYNKLVNQSRKKLEQIVENAADFETKCLDQEGELQILKNDFDTCHNQFEKLLSEHVQVNTTNKRKKEIEKEMIPLDAKSKSLIENTSRLENDLNKVKDKRKQFALARYIIENYILQGKH